MFMVCSDPPEANTVAAENKIGATPIVVPMTPAAINENGVGFGTMALLRRFDSHPFPALLAYRHVTEFSVLTARPSLIGGGFPFARYDPHVPQTICQLL